MSEISSGLVAPHDHPDFVGGIVWSRIELEWINKRLSDAEAIIAQKDAEILEQCRLNGMGAERELALLGQIERQSAALKLAKDALQTLGQYYAWLNFGECRTYGEHVPIVDMRLADLICKEALAAIDSLQEGE